MRRKSILIIFFLAICTAQIALAGIPEESPRVWGNSINNLQMSLTSIKSSWLVDSDPELQIAFRNTGENDFFLNLGITLGNGQNHFPTAITLLLVDTDGRSRNLQLSGPATLVGRIDDYAVGLGIRSMHVLRLRLSEFWSPDTNEFTMSLPTGHYKITARFQGDGPSHKNSGMEWTAWNFWKGILESNPLEIDIRNPK